MKLIIERCGEIHFRPEHSGEYKLAHDLFNLIYAKKSRERIEIELGKVTFDIITLGEPNYGPTE